MASNTLIPTFPNADMGVVKLIEKCDGAIFGGYLRDLYAGVQPNDMDIVLYRNHFEEFKSKIESLGYFYITPDDEKYGSRIFMKVDCITLEIILEDYDEKYPDIILGPCPDPDASVNLLNYFRKELHNWMGDNISPTDIIEQIKKRETWIFKNADPDRIKKIQTKGYTIVGNEQDP